MGVFGRAGPPKEAAGPPRVPQVPQIMVLGTYHMANPGRDYANIRADDVLAPRRQTEIAEVCRLLSVFAPARIGLEVPAADQDDLDRRFAAYVGGEAELRRNESDQIGLRLAKMLGHERIHAVDYRSDLDLAGVLAWARAHGQEALGARMQREVNRIAGDVQARMDRMTLRQILREDNSPEYDRLHGLYLTMATIGDTGQGEYIGAEITAAWYRRNIIIFSNVARLAASPDDRVLVIIGSGHGALLRQLVRECPDYRLVDVAEYL